MEFLIAQIMGLISAGIAMMAPQMKNKKTYTWLYALSYGFYIGDVILLKAYAGAVSSCILLVLTLVAAKYENKKMPAEILGLFAGVIFMGNMLTYTDVLSVLPAIASYLYLLIMSTDNMEKVRKMTIVLKLLWIVYNFAMCSYATCVMDSCTVILTLVAIHRFDKKAHVEAAKV